MTIKMTMKRGVGMKVGVIFLMVLSGVWMGCEDEIDVDLREGEPLLVVDAWINDKPEDQVILLSVTQSYFAREDAPQITGASVSIRDNAGTIYTFTERGNGEYVWSPTVDTPTFGQIGNDYTLTVETGGDIYQAVSRMNRVPVIDSVTFTFEEETIFQPDAYIAEFWARDFEGPGDAYWIRAYKNGELLNLPGDINIAFDAGFSEGDFDGVTFLPPIRAGINPDDENEDGDELSPYWPGDSVFVEIHSITSVAFDFLNEVSIQTNRPGGFAELFADPLANVPANLTHTNGDKGVVGFFNVAAVQGNGKRLE